ncbi:sigma factor-like helix-turn-helix DNA-binding protein [Streptacidiphilus rugosus]|uniref:sigma-70 region 4 domain-containing protein n=1 Tax=Streptacidiphilus rugosus TaxID=405783 RepID=UPI00068CC780|nr:sigma-70 region 4 domain-containing protein [Streptacidiphilus rugosus]
MTDLPFRLPSSLSKEAVEAWLEALEHGSVPQAPSGEGRPSPGAHPRSVYDELLRAGLLRHHVDTDMLVPVDPEAAALQAERQAREMWLQASRLQDEWSPLADAYRDARRKDGVSGSLVRYVEGKPAIAQQINLIASSAKTRVFAVQPGGSRTKESLDNSFPIDLALLRRGAQRRVMYQTPARKHPDTRDYVRALVEAGGEVRTADELYDRVVIADRTVIHPVDETMDSAVVITEPAIVEFHLRLFAQAWRAAEPFLEPVRKTDVPDGRRGDQLTAMQRRIVRMAVQEKLKHEVIARETGLSLRTVRRQLGEARRVFGGAPTTHALAWEIRGEYPEGFPADW